MERPYVHFPRDVCTGRFDQATNLPAPEFLDEWVDLPSIAGTKNHWDFPAIYFRAFRVQLARDEERYRIAFPDGAQAEIGERTYEQKGGNWLAR